MQIRISKLSLWQEKREAEYEEALAILKRNGIKAEYHQVFVSSPIEEPGYIMLSPI